VTPASYDLLVCDLDGTLLDDSMAPDPALVAAFRRASERGLTISLATGRMPAAADPYRDELGVTAPVIYYNGAVVRGGDGGPDLVSLTLPRGVLHRAWTVFSQAPVHPVFYRDDRLFCIAHTLAVRRYCVEEGLRIDVVDDPGRFLALGGFIKSLLIGHPKDLDIVREELTPSVAEHSNPPDFSFAGRRWQSLGKHAHDARILLRTTVAAYNVVIQDGFELPPLLLGHLGEMFAAVQTLFFSRDRQKNNRRWEFESVSSFAQNAGAFQANSRPAAIVIRSRRGVGPV